MAILGKQKIIDLTGYLQLGEQYTANSGFVGLSLNDAVNNCIMDLSGTGIKFTKSTGAIGTLNVGFQVLQYDTENISQRFQIAYGAGIFNFKNDLFERYTWKMSDRTISDTVDFSVASNNTIVLKKDLSTCLQVGNTYDVGTGGNFPIGIKFTDAEGGLVIINGASIECNTFYVVDDSSKSLNLSNRTMNDEIDFSAAPSNTIALKRDLPESILLQVPINSTIVNNATVTTLNLGTPTLLKGAGSINNYISVTGNVVKIKSTTAQVIKFSGIFLGDFASGTATNREFEFQITRPTSPFDIVHKINKVKLTATAVADVEYSFKTSFTSGETDPFFTDGFILRINNISGSNITGLTTRAGITTISSLRIEILA